MKKDSYLIRLKRLILDSLKDEPVKIIMFGSRARRDNHTRSDVDIGIIPYGDINEGKITELRSKVEDLNIPYKVEIADFRDASESFKAEALKGAVTWKD